MTSIGNNNYYKFFCINSLPTFFYPAFLGCVSKLTVSTENVYSVCNVNVLAVRLEHSLIVSVFSECFWALKNLHSTLQFYNDPKRFFSFICMYSNLKQNDLKLKILA